MFPLFRGYQDCSPTWARTHYERLQEAERTFSNAFLAQMSRYPFSTQASLWRLYGQYGLHAASLATDALERQNSSRLFPAHPNGEHEAGQHFVSALARYNFPTQELLCLIRRLHGLHAALLAMDALEHQRDPRFPLALPEL